MQIAKFQFTGVRYLDAWYTSQKDNRWLCSYSVDKLFNIPADNTNPFDLVAYNTNPKKKGSVKVISRGNGEIIIKDVSYYLTGMSWSNLYKDMPEVFYVRIIFHKVGNK